MGSVSICNCKNRELNDEMVISKEPKKMKLAKSNLKNKNLRFNHGQPSVHIMDISFLTESDKLKLIKIISTISARKIQKNFRKFVLKSSYLKNKTRDIDSTSNLQDSLIKVKMSFHSPYKKQIDYSNVNSGNKSKSLIFDPNNESICYSQSKNFFHKKSVDLINLSLISDDKLKINLNDENLIEKFLGNLVNGSKEGFGIEYWKDKSKFKGYFRENRVNGWGFYTHSDGDVFTGEFFNDQAGEFGIFRNPSGANYVGFWKENKQHGFGTEVMADRSIYIGDYCNGRKDGYGCFNWADGSKYQGYWRRNKINGFGLYEFNDGKSYMGEWKDNVMDGYGEFSWQDGKKYIGFYSNDKKEGFGIFYWKSSNKFFVGFWKDGKQDGPCKIVTESKTKFGLWKDGEKTETYSSEKETISSFSIEQMKYIKLFSQSLKSLKNYILNSK